MTTPRGLEVVVGLALLAVGIGRVASLMTGAEPPPELTRAEPWIWALFAIEYGWSNVFPYDDEEEAP